MKCIKCGKTATPVVRFGKVTGYTCEYYGKSFSVRDNGQASEKEMEILRQDQLQQIVANGNYKPLRIVVGEKLERSKYDYS